MRTFKVTMFLVAAILAVAFIGCAIFWPGDGAERSIVAIEWDADILDALTALEDAGIKIIAQLDIIQGFVARLTADQRSLIRSILPVRYIQPDYEVYILDPPPPRGLLVLPDTILASAEEISWPLEMCRFPEAWQKATGKGIAIGVIDTGIYTSHPDLQGAVIGGVNVIDGGSYEDDNNHGTYIAGAIAGRLNGLGIVGGAPDASLYAVKVLRASGSGSTSDVIKGYQWCLGEHKINPYFKSVNLSLGSRYPSRAMLDAMDVAAKQGMGTFAAAGNDSRRGLIYPAAYPVAVCVGAVDAKGDKAAFSNWGPALQANGVMAPGVRVMAANKNGDWNLVSGTSIATPYVTASHALRAEMQWAERSHEFKAASLGDSPTEAMGHGIIDAMKAIEVMENESR